MATQDAFRVSIADGAVNLVHISFSYRKSQKNRKGKLLLVFVSFLGKFYGEYYYKNNQKSS